MKKKKQTLGKRVVETIKFRAIFLARQRGADIAARHPEIADKWRSGATELAIGRNYCPHDNPNVARNAVHYALKLLCPEEERKRISQAHIDNIRDDNYKKGYGSLTHKELTDSGKKGARTRGEALYDDAPKETEFGEITERTYVCRLKSTGTPWKDIAARVNEVFGNNRTVVAIRTNYNARWAKHNY